MSYSDVPGFEASLEMNERLKSLTDDYARAKAAEGELKEAKKVIWLLLRQIGEPVTIDRDSLLQVPDDAEIYERREPPFDFITLFAKP